MRHRLILIIFSLTLVLGIAGLAARGVRAQDPTIPTRTPTPGAPPPTSPNPTATDDDQPNPPPPGATATTAAPGATAPVTATIAGVNTATATTAAAAGSATPVSTPDTRQAESCDDSPFITAVGVVYVYEGPGGDYNISATLQDGDTRRIVGRAGYADWWVIMLTSTETGWVDDQDVTVSGNTGLAPVIDPPPIGRATPTRGTPWNPTPHPFPTCPATATATATPTATASATATTSTTATAPAAASAEGTPAVESTAVTTDTSEPTAEVVSGTGLDSRGAGSARANSPTSAVNLILPLAGLALIAGGIVMALMTRNRGAKKPDEPKQPE